MPLVTRDGTRYQRNLPHYRTPGGTYHVRFSIADPAWKLTGAWMCQIIEEELLRLHKNGYLLFAYVIMSTHTHAVCQPLAESPNPLDWGDYRKYASLETLIGLRRLREFDRVCSSQMSHRACQP